MAESDGMPGRRTLAPALERLALLGVAASDSDATRAQKAALTLAATIVTVLSTAWVVTYLALGLPVSAAIPATYQVVSLAAIVVLARTKGYRFFRFSQAILMTLLPFLLQWSLGGYVASSAVSVWALVAAFGALFFYTAPEAIRWFLAFVALTVLSGLLDPLLARQAAPIPAPVQVAFFVLNVLGVSFTAYFLLQFAVRGRDLALARSEDLLLNVLPRSIAERLRREPGVIAEAHEDVTVLFADVVDFTSFSARTPPREVVATLDEIFSAFDRLAERHGLEKIKTIGDAYMVVGGLPDPLPDPAGAAAELALEMQDEVERVGRRLGLALSVRIGLDSGPVVAGVIGRRKFSYDLWGDTVNTASRMESQGVAGRIQVTERTYRLLVDRYDFEERGEIAVKGKGPERAYFLVGRR